MHLSGNYGRHICRKTFTKQNLDIHGYQFVINKNMSFTEYQMSYKGAAGKAFFCTYAYFKLNELHFSG
jgi:hypothetical protein